MMMMINQLGLTLKNPSTRQYSKNIDILLCSAWRTVRDEAPYKLLIFILGYSSNVQITD